MKELRFRVANIGSELAVILRDKDVQDFIAAFAGVEETQQWIDEIIDLYSKQEQGKLYFLMSSDVFKDKRNLGLLFSTNLHCRWRFKLQIVASLMKISS